MSLEIFARMMMETTALALSTPNFRTVCSTREKVFGLEFWDVDIRMDMHANIVLPCGTTIFKGSER